MKAFEPFRSLLKKIADPRRDYGKIYELPDIMLISILAIVSGANTYRHIHTFMDAKLKQLNELFNLNWDAAPAYTTIRYILRRLNPAAVEPIFREHAGLLNDNIEIPGKKKLAIDGKVLRGSFDAFNDVRARQILNIFDTITHLIIGHVEIDDKSNEIPATQKFLSELGLADHIITLDAMHCQKKTFEAAADADAHLIVQVKGNQEKLHRAVQDTCESKKPLSVYRTTDSKRRNRHEERIVSVFDALPAVEGTEWEPNVKALIMVDRHVQHFDTSTGQWEPSFERSFYLSNRSIDAKEAGRVIREHWGIENKLHYTRDVTFGEDASRIRVNPGIFAQLRSFAYNIIQFNRHAMISFPQARFWAASVGIEGLAELDYVA